MLHKQCKRFSDKLETQCMDINDFLSSTNKEYDVVVTNSFLHHIPDYLSLIRNAVGVLTPLGQYFAFQDPLRYDTVGKPTKLFTDMGYFFWPSTKGNIMRGVKTRIRCLRGIYSEEHEEDTSPNTTWLEMALTRTLLSDYWKKKAFIAI